jgi:diaminohydroxyphosphoribosylaminopyrimidine deaminase/5-amino-6-(5-phosphoribosylamino)uracil reductase
MRRPNVIASVAQSVDGRIATITGASRYISGPETTTLAHEIRDHAEGILVGIGTVLRDDPELSCRLPGGTSPARIILDARLRMPVDSRIVETAGSIPTVLCTAPEALRTRAEVVRNLRDRGLAVIETPVEGRNLLLEPLLETLLDRGVGTLFVEGGSRVLASFLAARAIDTMLFVMAPIVMGEGTPVFSPEETPAATERAMGQPFADISLETVGLMTLGNDLVWEVSLGYDR